MKKFRTWWNTPITWKGLTKVSIVCMLISIVISVLSYVWFFWDDIIKWFKGETGNKKKINYKTEELTKENE